MSTAKGTALRLSQQPEMVTWPETHYVYIEKIGPFQETAPQAWQELRPLIPAISEQNKITGYTSLYKVAPRIYRAGVSVESEPKNLSAGMKYLKFEGGKYSRFVLTGPYSNLPEASARVFQIVAGQKIKMRDDFCIENYVNDPRTTPESELITQILIPAA
jgi:effector-binding domain-containing protein